MHVFAKLYRRLMLFLCLMIVVISIPSRAEVVVIVHPSNDSTIDDDTIKKIFMGKTKKFSNGQIALPMNSAKGSATREEFSERAIGRSSSQINAHWSKLVFTGKGSMPKELDSDAEVISTIAANQGAIGYVSPDAVTGNVKVVATYK